MIMNFEGVPDAFSARIDSKVIPPPPPQVRRTLYTPSVSLIR